MKKPLLNLTGKSVAVVGNSVSLFDNKHGPFIDKHDVVIRFNRTPTHYSELDTSMTHGEKFDLWAFWSINAFMRTVHEDPTATRLINLIEDHSLCKVEMIASRSHKSRNYSNLAHRLYLYQDFKKIKREINGRNEDYNPSSGFLLLRWLASNERIRYVNIFGMDFKKTPTFAEENFKTNVVNQIDTNCNHHFANEERIIRETVFDVRKNFRIIE